MAGPVIRLVLKKVDELLTEEVKLLLGVKRQLNALRDQLKLITAFLMDLDSKQQTQRSQVMKAWIGELRDAAAEAEDVVDQFFLEVDQDQHDGFVGCLKGCVICIRETPARHDLGGQIEEVTAKIGRLFDNKRNFEIEIKEISAGFVPSSSGTGHGPSESDKAAIAEGLGVVGFVEVESQISKQLLGGEDDRKVLSVVGMGGLGKTTIVKKIFNRADLEVPFRWKVWITVSRHYAVDELLRNILRGFLNFIPGSSSEKQRIADMSEEDLVDRLKFHLHGVKYLVVVDDIWDNRAWDHINRSLPAESTGSRVMLTTRIMGVALYAHSSVHELPFLSEEESWELFCRKVFPGAAGCPPELKVAGQEMVKKCRGLPLAIVVLGGLLTGKPQSRYEWQKIGDRLSRDLSKERNQMIKDILALSYHDLPYEQKLCFLYMGLFPEDVEIDTTRLTQLWVAEGFVNQEDGRRTVEETAEQHLESLANRSILQVVERDAIGLVSNCKIHDLLLDLAYSEGEENRFLDVHRPDTANHKVNTRRLAVHQNANNCASSSSTCLIPKLHTLLCFNVHGLELCDLFTGLRLLRVVDIEGVPVDKLPEEIGDIVHLRYLGLRRTKLSTLPVSVKRLIKLETIDVTDVRGITLPDAVWRMKTMRHVHAYNILPTPSCGEMKDLQTLHSVIAGKWIPVSLRRLTGLRKLGIKGVTINHVKPLSESMERLSRLKFLKLEGDLISNVLGLSLSRHESLHSLHLKGEMKQLTQIIRAENLPPNLTQVVLIGSKLEQDPLALLQHLPYLNTLKLQRDAFAGETMACSANGYPRLQELYLHSLTNLQYLNMEDGSMRCLKSLSIDTCGKLEELPEGLKNAKNVKELVLEKMPPEFTDKIEEGGADWYKVQHIPLIRIG